MRDFWNLKYIPEVNGYLPDPLPDSRKFKQYISQPVQHKNLKLLPDIYTKSKDFVDYLDECATVLDSELPVDTWTGQGFVSSGVENGFSNLRQIQGIAGTPYGTPPRDTDTYRIRNLEASDNPIHQEFAKNPVLDGETISLMDRVFRLLINVPSDPPKIPMKLSANAGLWDFEVFSDSSTAAHICDRWLKHPEPWIDLIRSRDYMTLAKQGIILAYGVGYRIQPNSFTLEGLPRGRESFNYDEEWVPINFEINDEFTKRGFFAVRPRVINMGSLGMFPLRICARDAETYFKQEFPYCFLTKSPSHLTEKTALATSIEMYDVKNHDWSASEEQLESLLSAFELRYYGWVIEMMRESFYAPDFVQLDDPNESRPITAKWRGKIGGGREYNDYTGNRSGIPITSIVAKAWGVWYSVYGLWKRGDIQNTDEDIIKCLRGEHHNANVLNAGDNIIIVNMNHQKNPISNFVNIAVLDDTRTFQGWVPLGGKTGAPVWVPNPESAVKKWLMHDNSVGSLNRPEWAGGWFRRWEYFAQNPAAEAALQIIDEIAKRHFGRSITDMAKQHYRAPVGDIANMSEEDRMFLEDSAYIHYRLAIESVSPELLERVYKLYTSEATEHLTNLMRR